jgi:hypothetical protein
MRSLETPCRSITQYPVYWVCGVAIVETFIRLHLRGSFTPALEQGEMPGLEVSRTACLATESSVRSLNLNRVEASAAAAADAHQYIDASQPCSF